MTNDELTDELEKANARIISLHKRLMRIEKGKSQTGLPNTMILSHSFLKRAFAVYGHVFVVGLIIMIPLWFLMFLFSLFMGALMY